MRNFIDIVKVVWVAFVCLMGIYGIFLILAALIGETLPMPSDAAAAITFQGKLFMNFGTGVWLVWLSDKLMTYLRDDKKK